MSVPAPADRVAGLIPWLPWPLSAWKWWTEPVRAERLAVLRIALAGCLLVDVLLTYLPEVFTFFGRETLGDPLIFGWRFGAPRLSWSLLGGFGDPLLSFLALAAWSTATVWLLADLGTRAAHGGGPREGDALRYSVPVWCVAGTLLTLGIWSRLANKEGELAFAWLPPAILLSVSGLCLLLQLVGTLRNEGDIDVWALARLGVACILALSLLVAGMFLWRDGGLEPGAAWARILAPWQNDQELLRAAMIAWAGATLFLMLGLFTRPAAIVTWALSLSFANLNSNIDNAGDTIRGIVLFYLMFCPCGAVWSLDWIWQRRRDPDGSAAVVRVAPWPIRLLFVQMVFMYGCNGVYKLYGGPWRDGESLFYVLGDFTLTRISLADVPLPMWCLRVMTWSVLAWEVSFPVLVLNRWTRIVALLFGAAFHLGIFFTMELGFFVPYALCLYLPLLPWDRWLARRAVSAAQPHAGNFPSRAGYVGESTPEIVSGEVTR